MALTLDPAVVGIFSSSFRLEPQAVTAPFFSRNVAFALAAIAPYFLTEPALGTPAAGRFDELAALIEAYEARHWAIEPAGQTRSV